MLLVLPCLLPTRQSPMMTGVISLLLIPNPMLGTCVHSVNIWLSEQKWKTMTGLVAHWVCSATQWSYRGSQTEVPSSLQPLDLSTFCGSQIWPNSFRCIQASERSWPHSWALWYWWLWYCSIANRCLPMVIPRCSRHSGQQELCIFCPSEAGLIAMERPLGSGSQEVSLTMGSAYPLEGWVP